MASAAEPAEALRSRQTDLTKQVILEALADLVVEEGVHAFSVRDVAKRAGVSQRTVYNHFPNRRLLLDGLAEVIDQAFRDQDLREPESLEDLDDSIAAAFEALGEMDRMVQAYVMLTIGARIQARVREERSSRVEEILRRDLGGHVEPAAVPAVAGVIRLLFSSTAWYLLVHHHRVDADVGGRTVQWALDLIVEELLAGRGPDLSGVDEATTTSTKGEAP